MDSTVDTLSTVELGDLDHAQYSIIWLHGLGADGHDFVSLVPELDLPKLTKIHFVFPHAPIRPVTINGGMAMPAWFDIYNLDKSGPIDEEGIRSAVAAIHRLIDREIAQGIRPENIILAGFSQGGCIALLSGLFYPQRLGGVIGLSTFLWKIPDFDQHRQAANQETPIFLAHGSSDPIVPLALGEQTALLLKNAGYPVSLYTYPMAHSVCREEIRAISLWLQERGL